MAVTTDLTGIAMRYADEVWNAQDLDAADELFTATTRTTTPCCRSCRGGPEGVREPRRVDLGAMPDATVRINRIAAGGEPVAAD